MQNYVNMGISNTWKRRQEKYANADLPLGGEIMGNVVSTLYFSLLSRFPTIIKYCCTAFKVKKFFLNFFFPHKKHALKVSHCLQKAPGKMQICYLKEIVHK